MDVPGEANIGPGQALKVEAACQFFLNFQRFSMDIQEKEEKDFWF